MTLIPHAYATHVVSKSLRKRHIEIKNSYSSVQCTICHCNVFSLTDNKVYELNVCLFIPCIAMCIFFLENINCSYLNHRH